MISIGVYINRDSLCFAEMISKGAQPELYSLEEHFFEKQNSEDQKILFISEQLKKIEEKHKGKNLYFCCGLSQNFVTSFLVEFPFKEKFKILKTLPFEIEENTPFDPKKVFFDARICKVEKNKSSVLCFVTPEENVNEFFNLGKSLKRPLHLLSCEGSALANLVEKWNMPLSQTQILEKQNLYVYLGAQDSVLLFYKKGHLQQVSVLEWAVAPIINEMGKLYNLTIQKAWEEFFTKAFVLTEVKGFTKEQIFFSNIIKKQLQFLIPRLKLLIMSIETKQNISFSDIVVFGPGSVIKNLTAFLTREMSVRFSRLQKYPDFSFDFKQQTSSADIALGLALEGLKPYPYRGLNFLQSRQKEKFSFFSKKWQGLALAGLLVFVIWTAYAFVRQKESFKTLNKIQSVFSNYGKKIAYLSDNQLNEEALNSFLEEGREKIKNEQWIQKQLNKAHPIKHLQFLTQKLGSAEKWGLSIHYLKITGRTIEIKGQIQKSSLENFKSQLQDLSEKPIKESKWQGIQPDVKDKGEEQEEENLSLFSYSFKLKKGY